MVETSNATLKDVFSSADWIAPLVPQVNNAKSLIENNNFTFNDDGFNFESVLFDNDGNHSTTHDQIRLNTNSSLHENTDFKFYITSEGPLNTPRVKINYTLVGTSEINFEYGPKIDIENYLEDVAEIENDTSETVQLDWNKALVRIPVGVPENKFNILVSLDYVIQLKGSIQGLIKMGFKRDFVAILDTKFRVLSPYYVLERPVSITGGNPEFYVAVSSKLDAEFNVILYRLNLEFPQFRGKEKNHIRVDFSPFTLEGNAEAEIVASTQETCVRADASISAKAKITLDAEIDGLIDLLDIDINRTLLEGPLPFENWPKNFSYEACLDSPSLSASTNMAGSVTSSTAICGGSVTSTRGASVTERGICWSTNQNPSISSNEGREELGSGTGSFSHTITGLTASNTYYVRAYALNSEGTPTYGNQIDFTTEPEATNPLLTVTTNSITNPTQTTAVGSGNVTSSGGATVAERGICWSTNQNPSISSNEGKEELGSGTGSFSHTITGLTASTTYYVRAYALNSEGTPTYGDQIDFTTEPEATNPVLTVTTNSITNPTQTTAVGSGNVASAGGATVTERGICWSTNQNPSISSNEGKEELGSGTGSFSHTITGLTASTTYYVRAYALNSEGTPTYGNQIDFITEDENVINKPTVLTNAIINITQTTAVSGGNVSDDGGANVTARGICWSTSPEPTLQNTNLIAQNGPGTGNFQSTLTNLTPDTQYYVRAYASNSEGTAYGTSLSFFTLADSGQPNIIATGLIEIDDDTGGGSNGNDNQIPEAGEEIELSIQLQNLGTSKATNVSAILSTNDNDIDITDPDESYGTIEAGSTDWNTDFDFTIDNGAQSKAVNFDLTVTSDEGTWMQTLSIDIVGQSGNEPPVNLNNSPPKDSCLDSNLLGHMLELDTEYYLNNWDAKSNISLGPDGFRGMWYRFKTEDTRSYNITIEFESGSSYFEVYNYCGSEKMGPYFTTQNLNLEGNLFHYIRFYTTVDPDETSFTIKIE